MIIVKKCANITKILFLFFLLLIIASNVSCSGSSSDSTDGDEILREAQKMEETAYYRTAYDYYKSAFQAFTAEGDAGKASYCRQKTFDLNITLFTYPISKDKLLEKMQSYNPQYTPEDLKLWLSEGRLDYMTMDGAPWYYENCFTNLSYRYPDVLVRDKSLMKSINYLSSKILDYIKSHTDIGLSDPHRFEASEKLAIPRNKLPANGTLKIWLPFPIQTAAQKELEIVSVTPENYWKEGPEINSDIGCVYFEIPLAELKKDLNIEVRFRFTCYQQRFDIDPDKVGEYDVNSELYVKYTRSDKNLAVTEAIKQKAREIVGSETNPYRKAKLIADYMAKNIKYSNTPQYSEEALGHPISVFVQEKGYGDCGCQAIYFAALCRAAGIPARATGGYELWVPNGSGHFWAEFYLPAYGWIPLDPSLTVATSLSDETDESDKEVLCKYMFGNMDPYRLIFQNDTDTVYTPAPSEPPFTTISFQVPMAECREMEDNPTTTILNYYKWEIRELDN